MNEDAQRIFTSLLNVEVQKLEAKVASDIRRDLAQLSVSGNLVSSGGFLKLVSNISSAIPIEAQVAMTLLLRSLTAHEEHVNAGSKEEIKQILVAHVKQRSLRLKELIKDTPSFRSPHASDAFLKGFEVTVSQEIERIRGEIDLIAAANDRREPQETKGNSSYVFNAPVGLVQTGTGNFGIANQVLDTNSKELILDALKSLQEALDKDQPLDRDIAELVLDAKAEAAKDQPNLPKLKALLSGLGGAISGLPKLREAYDTIKWASSLVGINLP